MKTIDYISAKNKLNEFIEWSKWELDPVGMFVSKQMLHSLKSAWNEHSFLGDGSINQQNPTHKK